MLETNVVDAQKWMTIYETNLVAGCLQSCGLFDKCRYARQRALFSSSLSLRSRRHLEGGAEKDLLSNDDKHSTECDEGSDLEMHADNGMVAGDGSIGSADLEVLAHTVIATQDSPNEDAKSVCPLRLVSMQANDVEMGEFIDFLMNDTYPP
ncbi:hypothetical protein L3X38_011752 [Prunus dulcis]|uniref:Uncharacterized protein n=1 Tax=Prunus dulcis TaxID=3755 RepID=A0AAD4WKF4_PRUDU|nr:hypothetical protein L3X38_011752 [Prunus dulcis]